MPPPPLAAAPAPPQPVRARRLRAPSLRHPQSNDDTTTLLSPPLEAIRRASDALSHDRAAVAACIDPLLQLRPLLAASSAQDRFKDDFRLLHGFEAVFQLVGALAASFGHSPPEPTATELDVLSRLVPAILGLFSDALFENVLNRQHVEALRTVGTTSRDLIVALGLTTGSSADRRNGTIKVFGQLLSCAMHDEVIHDDFVQLVAAVRADAASDIQDTRHADQVINKYLAATGLQTGHLGLGEILPMILAVWQQIPQSSQLAAASVDFKAVAFALFLALLKIIRKDKNAIPMVHTAFTDLLLTSLRHHDPPLIHRTIYRLLLKCTRLGLRSLAEADKIFQMARADEHGSQMLLECLRGAREPPFILFDMTISGHASVEFSELPRAFPPQDPCSGYSFLAWIKVLSFDPSSHTTIFGAFDQSQACFILIYLEKATQHLVLQTSVTLSKPSVRFKSVRFEPGRWYHIGIVQKRLRGDMPTHAALFVDGELVEQARCPYPRIPAASRVKLPSGSFAPQSDAVQAFFGTPRDLAPRLGPGVISSSWALASSHLLSEAIPDELVFVYKSLGPHYHGNFQDSLGSFQTFRASARLNLRNEQLHPGNEEDSLIAKAVRSNAGHLNPERNIILSVAPATMLHKRPGSESLSPWSVVAGALNPRAFDELRRKTRNGANSLILNARTPLVEDALMKATGIGVLIGPAVVSSALSLDDAAWLHSGWLPMSLELIAAAASKASLVRAAEIFFEFINDSWRNSEIAERENGFGMLTLTLAKRLRVLEMAPLSSPTTARPSSPITSSATEADESTYLQLLKAVLFFVGYDFASPEYSRIVNPLAYRTLLVDFDIWKTADVPAQELYYKQFVVFAQQSRYKVFNSRRLGRMRIVKNLIESLKERGIVKAVAPHMLKAFSCILQCTSTADVYRSTALFITSVLQEDKASASPRIPKPRPSSSRSFGSYSGRGASGTEHENFLRGPQLGTAVLEMLTECLLEDARGTRVRKFANSVTNKWLLHLLAEGSNAVTIPAVKILARVFGVLGHGYVDRFEQKTKGFIVLQEHLKQRWHLQEAWCACFAILFGKDQLLPVFELPELAKALQPTQATVVYPAIVPVILSMLGQGFGNLDPSQASSIDRGEVLVKVLQAISYVYRSFAPFREYMGDSGFAKDSLKIVFDPNHGQTHGHDPFISEDMGSISQSTSTETLDISRPNLPSRHQRTLSFVIVGPRQREVLKIPDLKLPMAPAQRQVRSITTGHRGEEIMIDSLCLVFVDQILRRKDFTGLGLYLKAPPGPLEYRSQLASQITRDISKHLIRELESTSILFQEPRVLNNIARFVLQTCEALYEGWLVHVEEQFLNFTTSLIHHLENPEMRSVKNVRLCSPQISQIRIASRQIALFSLLVNKGADTDALENVLVSMLAMQDLLLPRESDEEMPFRALCSVLYQNLWSDATVICTHTSSLWRSLIAQKPDEVATVLTTGLNEHEMNVGVEFCVAMQEYDNPMPWLEENRPRLDKFFSTGPHVALAEFIDERNRTSEESSKARLQKRKARLEQWHLEEISIQHALTEQSMTTRHWNANISEAELLKFYRARQDHSENLEYLEGLCSKQGAMLARIRDLSLDDAPIQWQLDDCEGRDRMRMRLKPFQEERHTAYRPKRMDSKPPKIVEETIIRANDLARNTIKSRARSVDTNDAAPGPSPPDEDFEVVADPQKAEDTEQDKNRRVMRGLQTGEEVEDARNISIIRGLEAQETLMILGKHALYLVENLFLRADGEVVNAWEAPDEERDPYIKMISGQKVEDASTSRVVDVKPKRWPWSDIVSISERQFLLRDVAIEVFFKDGRSYLATAVNKTQRDQISAKLSAKTMAIREPPTAPSTESMWRNAILKATKEAPSSFGSKVAGLFNTSSAKAARKQWQKGEMSNFQYLMLINTLAGRTFNDLTQYPVFPWVIADYASDELDLGNPKSFRDLTKPMGCQTPERESAFRERYFSFAEMDPETPPFHYGTHYSSAMIVCSYLIRLQPFVKSYLLLQGGAFDHAERLFDSVERAWRSASREGFTDVRELTPEFFYLPDFLVNINKYNFGTKQSTGEVIDHVKLPPWAKGDPAVFIAKNREALESPYVSQNLSSWIDLVFGFKQRGEAALEATNVFHHLSYQGAKDLDKIQDDMERIATIGIIHNFGQTPPQIFSRPHDRREVDRVPGRSRVETYRSLARPHDPIAVTNDQVWHVDLRALSRDRKRALFGPWRVPMPSDPAVELIWGLTDQSLRLWSSTSNRFINIHEQPHSDQVSAVVWGEERQAFTGAEDGTIHAWNVSIAGSVADIQQRGPTMLGHRSGVEHLVISNAFGTLLSAERDGRVLAWSTSTLELVRCVAHLPCVSALAINDSDGTIAMCTDDAVEMFTFNGQRLLAKTLSTWESGPITSCAWARQESSGDVVNRVFATGHYKGVVQVWNVHATGRGEWKLDAVRLLEHESSAAVTCVIALMDRIYVGMEDGKLYEWIATR